MDEKLWEESGAKKLLDLFLEIEESYYSKGFQENVKQRSDIVRRFIMEFGVNRVTINTYTNLILYSSSLTIDIYDSKRWHEGNIIIDLGSGSKELTATKEVVTFGKKKEKVVSYIFDFKNWVWIEKERK